VARVGLEKGHDRSSCKTNKQTLTATQLATFSLPFKSSDPRYKMCSKARPFSPSLALLLLCASLSMASKIILGLVLALLVYGAAGEKNPSTCSRSAQQCQIRRLRTVEPSRRLVSEGGVTEVWDTNEDEFQCAGVAAIRHTLQPNSQSQPNYQPAPMLVYIEQGLRHQCFHFLFFFLFFSFLKKCTAFDVALKIY
jgi:hypothetical protein